MQQKLTNTDSVRETKEASRNIRTRCKHSISSYETFQDTTWRSKTERSESHRMDQQHGGSAVCACPTCPPPPMPTGPLCHAAASSPNAIPNKRAASTHCYLTTFQAISGLPSTAAMDCGAEGYVPSQGCNLGVMKEKSIKKTALSIACV